MAYATWVPSYDTRGICHLGTVICHPWHMPPGYRHMPPVSYATWVPPYDTRVICHLGPSYDTRVICHLGPSYDTRVICHLGVAYDGPPYPVMKKRPSVQSARDPQACTLYSIPPPCPKMPSPLHRSRCAARSTRKKNRCRKSGKSPDSGKTRLNPTYAHTLGVSGAAGSRFLFFLSVVCDYCVVPVCLLALCSSCLACRSLV